MLALAYCGKTYTFIDSQISVAMIEKLTVEQKSELTYLVMTMLDDWGVSNRDKITLLSLTGHIKSRAIARYYQGESVPDDPAVFERIEHLLGIADALRTSFPLNGQMAAYWLNQKNERFENMTPLSYMLEGGDDNVIAVRAHLDCGWDWHREESN
ncbi:MAG: DUF2384 domain-containing protein [Gammaproteobacteria bacterium]